MLLKFSDKVKKKNTLVSGNASNVKNLHPDDHNFFFNLFNLIFKIKFTLKELF